MKPPEFISIDDSVVVIGIETGQNTGVVTSIGEGPLGETLLQVEFPDGKSYWYEPHELVRLPQGGPTQ